MDNPTEKRREQIRQNVARYRRRHRQQCGQVKKQWSIKTREDFEGSIHLDDDKTRSHSNEAYQLPSPHHGWSLSYQRNVSIPAETGLYADSLIGCLLGHVLPASNCRPHHWMFMLPALVNREPALDCAIRALSLRALAQKSQDSKIVKSSFDMYGTTMQSLREGLTGPARMKPIDILTTALLLATFEVS